MYLSNIDDSLTKPCCFIVRVWQLSLSHGGCLAGWFAFSTPWTDYLVTRFHTICGPQQNHQPAFADLSFNHNLALLWCQPSSQHIQSQSLFPIVLHGTRGHSALFICNLSHNLWIKAKPFIFTVTIAHKAMVLDHNRPFIFSVIILRSVMVLLGRRGYPSRTLPAEHLNLHKSGVAWHKSSPVTQFLYIFLVSISQPTCW